MNQRSSSGLVLCLLALALAACSSEKKPPVAPAPAPTSEATIYSAPVRAPETRPVSPSIAVSEDIARACKIEIGNLERAPKFEFDRSELLSADYEVLGKIARCVKEGHLGTRALKLIGRADPRGTNEYNMVLGARRAHSVGAFLGQLGLDTTRIQETSRGELDAIGTDETSWQIDRRVDIVLAE